MESSEDTIRLLSNESRHYQSTLKLKKKKSCCDGKAFAFFSIGTITMLYCIGELGIGLYLHSLTLLSDGFHNLSDVVSIIIGYVANRMKDKHHDQVMSYGYARTELIGAFLNACFLLSLSFYIILESIPRFINPPKFEMETGFIFIYVAAAGLGANTLGTIVFCICGGGHGHSHAGGGHGHSHGGNKKKLTESEEDHGHSHSEKKKNKEKDHGHSHSEKKKEKDHGHSHSEKKKEKDHGHSHSELTIEGDTDEGHSHSEKDHGHSHSEKKKEKDHGHSHSEKKKEKDHGHSHSEKKKDKDHGHSHSEKKKNKDHGHSHAEEKEDMNMKAIFLHYFGDMISSLFVLGQGVLLHFFPDTKYGWAKYIDPSVSLIIVFIILITTIPFVKNVIKILVQSTPAHVEFDDLKRRINQIEGVLSLHDLHVWQLVDGVVISSIHVNIVEGSNFKKIAKKIKKIFHEQGIHSTSIQPEFVSKDEMRNFQYCEEMCVEDCEEDWCCKKPADLMRNSELIIN